MTRRVAFFTDSFHEVNGVALTSREFVAFAQRRSIPLFSVHAGKADRIFSEGSVSTVEFRRAWPRWTLEHDLAIDLLFLRHRKRLRAALDEFRPDLVHITGPGDMGILGAILAYDLRVPLVASWHTNLHEFGARRLERVLRFLPDSSLAALGNWAERTALDQCVRFYRLARLLFAPNPELVELLQRRTGRPTHLMMRGIDTSLFSPSRRVPGSKKFVVGYVGRLSPEKNVRMLARIDEILSAGPSSGHYQFLIVGEGRERPWLQQNMNGAQLPGVLRGEELARAYASMDVFVFPSNTDTFGNVVLEAFASGVPAIVTTEGGPKFLITPGHNGLIATGPEGFAEAIDYLINDPDLLEHMRRMARESAQRYSWDAVLEEVHRHYELCFPLERVACEESPHEKACV